MKHPSGLPVLFFAEMWERFSFYGMRSLLTLYMKGPLGYAHEAATSVFHAYGALVYTFPMAGGVLADRLLGFRLAILLGAILMALGHFVMAIPTELALYCALALLCLGNGLFKPNISGLVGQLYGEGDTRRDAGFTIFYMGINLGAFLAPLVCGSIGERIDWHFGFGLAGIGMLVGLLWFVLGKARLEGHGEPPDRERLHRPRLAGLSAFRLLLLVVALAIAPVALALWRNDYLSYLLYPLGLVVYGGLVLEARRRPREQRDRLLVAMVLMFGSTVFWAMFEQAGSSLTLFTDSNVDRELIPQALGLRRWLGASVPASVFLAFNPLYIIMLALPFARLWTRLKERRRDPSVPLKFGLGLAQLGAGFLLLVFVGVPLAGADKLVHVNWLLLMYLLHTTGELCLSPVGLSAMTKLATRDMTGTVMGAWFLAAAYSQVLGSTIAAATAVEPKLADGAIDPAVSLEAYAGVFETVGWIAVVLGGLFMLAAPRLRRLMHGVA
jgi:POT family proton-dependent oligopeptide transporter